MTARCREIDEEKPRLIERDKKRDHDRETSRVISREATPW